MSFHCINYIQLTKQCPLLTITQRTEDITVMRMQGKWNWLGIVSSGGFWYLWCCIFQFCYQSYLLSKTDHTEIGYEDRMRMGLAYDQVVLLMLNLICVW